MGGRRKETPCCCSVEERGYIGIDAWKPEKFSPEYRVIRCGFCNALRSFRGYGSSIIVCSLRADIPRLLVPFAVSRGRSDGVVVTPILEPSDILAFLSAEPAARDIAIQLESPISVRQTTRTRLSSLQRDLLHFKNVTKFLGVVLILFV